MQNMITKSVFASLLLVSAVASADNKYPAADFQPSVVFQDEAYINANKAPATTPAVKAVKSVKPFNNVVEETDSKYPAANFQPKVIFSDDAATKAPAPVVVEEVDPKYPAANFQPKVVYSDDNYKPSASTPVTSYSTSAPEIEETVTTPVVAKKDDNSTYLLGLLGLAAVGFFLFKGKCPLTKCTKTEVAPEVKTPVAAPVATGLTGVARYLNKKSGTGVARYLEKQNKTPTTGVARYMAKQLIAKAKQGG